ncbi:MAG: C4-dicarboxylate TRAP transporter substrate-binding protein [Desulfobacterales bacterium]
MKFLKYALSIMITAVLIVSVPIGSISAKTYKITVAAGHPPIFLWVTLCRDFFIPEVNKRLVAAGHKIEWNQAYGGTVAKIGGVLEAIEEGIADMGFVGTIFEASKMPLHNVTYMTPFGTDNIFYVVDTMAELQKKIPQLAKEWTRHNQIYLGGAALDTYGILTSFPVNTVDDVKGHKIAAPGPSANWLKGTGGVPVASNLNEYYNGIKTGVFEGTLTFMTAASAIKVYEVAPYINMVNFGSQFAGGLSINKDLFESFPQEVKNVFTEVGRVYTKKLAEAQAARAGKAISMMQKGGAKLINMSDEERTRWADKLPNVPMAWVKSMQSKGLPGKAMLKGFLNGLRTRGVKLVRDWDK